MRKTITFLAGSSLLWATSLSAQDTGGGARRTIGSPFRPSATAPSSTTPNTAPASSPPTSAPSRAAGSSPFRPSTQLPGQDVGGGMTGGAVGDEVAQPPALGGGAAAPARSRVDTASRFQAGDAAASPPAFGRGALGDAVSGSVGPTEPADYPRSPAPSAVSSGLSRQPSTTSGAATTRAAAARTSTPAEAASPVAEMVLTQALQPRLNPELPGQPLPLSQVFERTNGPGQRIKAVQTYWKVVMKLAAYRAALDDRAMYQGVSVRQGAQHERAVLAAAQQSASAAVHRAELEVVTAQNELIEAALLTDTNAQPLPSDLPLVSEYRTAFSAMYGERAAPSGLRRLDRAMPYHLQDVRAQADAVVAAQQAVQVTAEAVTAGNASVMELVNVTKLLASERQAFMLSVFDYNAAIAEYALHVAPAGENRAALTSMLIKSRPGATRSATVIREEGEILPVAAQETIISDVILPASASRSAVADTAPDLQEPARRFSREPFTPKQPLRYNIQDEVQIPLDEPQPITDTAPQPDYAPPSDNQPGDMPQLVPSAGGNYGQE